MNIGHPENGWRTKEFIAVPGRSQHWIILSATCNGSCMVSIIYNRMNNCGKNSCLERNCNEKGTCNKQLPHQSLIWQVIWIKEKMKGKYWLDISCDWGRGTKGEECVCGFNEKCPPHIWTFGPLWVVLRGGGYVTLREYTAFLKEVYYRGQDLMAYCLTPFPVQSLCFLCTGEMWSASLRYMENTSPLRTTAMSSKRIKQEMN